MSSIKSSGYSAKDCADHTEPCDNECAESKSKSRAFLAAKRSRRVGSTRSRSRSGRKSRSKSGTKRATVHTRSKAKNLKSKSKSRSNSKSKSKSRSRSKPSRIHSRTRRPLLVSRLARETPCSEFNAQTTANTVQSNTNFLPNVAVSETSSRRSRLNVAGYYADLAEYYAQLSQVTAAQLDSESN